MKFSNGSDVIEATKHRTRRRIGPYGRLQWRRQVDRSPPAALRERFRALYRDRCLSSPSTSALDGVANPRAPIWRCVTWQGWSGPPAVTPSPDAASAPATPSHLLRLACRQPGAIRTSASKAMSWPEDGWTSAATQPATCRSLVISRAAKPSSCPVLPPGDADNTIVPLIGLLMARHCSPPRRNVTCSVELLRIGVERPNRRESLADRLHPRAQRPQHRPFARRPAFSFVAAQGAASTASTHRAAAKPDRMG